MPPRNCRDHNARDEIVRQNGRGVVHWTIDEAVEVFDGKLRICVEMYLCDAGVRQIIRTK